MPSLPRHDPDPNLRSRTLEQKRKEYRITHAKYDGLCMLAELPAAERPPAEWSALLERALKDAVGSALRQDRDRGSLVGGLTARVRELRVVLSDLAGGREELVNDVTSILLGGALATEAASLDDYRSFFRTVPLPDWARAFPDGDHFSAKVVRGSNPESLERVRVLDPAFPVTDAHLAEVSEGDSLRRALDEHRLYHCDYGMLADLPANELGGLRRQVFAPRVMYAVPRGGRSLRAFAIQIGRTPGPANPIFRRSDGVAWRIAEVHASAADTIAGALWFHHARTHLVTEPFAVAMHRHLAPSHPLHALLAPHVLGTLYINEIGWQTVFATHGLLDWFTGTPRDAVRALSRRSVESYRLDEQVLPDRLAARGVDDAEALPDFPWRDDVRPLWDALERWVGGYVDAYYPTDAEVAADRELQGFVAEVAAADGGAIAGLPEGGRFVTRRALRRTLTQVIYQVSALHSSMNFPVSEEMAFVPNSPFAVYAEPPRSVAEASEALYLRTLPPLDAAQRQFATAWLLGAARYGELGRYADGTFVDPVVAPLLARFRADLDAADAAATVRDATRTPYPWLRSRMVAPSINI
jgi:arachidonate 15-lipoxygenase